MRCLSWNRCRIGPPVWSDHVGNISGEDIRENVASHGAKKRRDPSRGHPGEDCFCHRVAADICWQGCQEKPALAPAITPGDCALPAQDLAALGYPYAVSLRFAELNHLACVFGAQFLRIGIDKPSPSLAMKRLPRALGLSEAIRHRV